MQRRLKIPPTKSTLLALRRQLAFLEQGHMLLERKKELLTRLVYDRLAQYRALRNETRDAVAEAYRWLAITRMRMGATALRELALGMPPAIEIGILPRSNVGVEYPAVTAHVLPPKPVGLLGTDASFDATRASLAELAVKLARLGEAETALWRLLEEQRKMQKRVNALRYNVIPRYRNTLHYVRSCLEEEERSTLFQIKVLREQGASGGESPTAAG